LATDIEQHIINSIRKKRLELNITQLELSQRLEMNDSFISHVEAKSRRAKYNLNHLNAIAKIFKCSPKDFWPERAI